VLVGAEAGARSIGGRLEDPVEWGDAAQSAKVAQMDALAEHGCVPVVAAGNSMVRDAVVPDVVAGELGGTAVYNAALDAAGPDLVGAWVTDQVAPRLEPATVVVGLASMDLNEASPAARAATEAYRAAPGGRPGWWGALDRAARDASALVRHRGELRHPDALWSALGGDRSPGPVLEDGRPVLPGVLGPDGEGRSRVDLEDPGPTGPAARFAASQLLAGFDPGRDPAGRVAELLVRVGGGETDRRVVAVLLPTTPGFAELHPGGRAQQDAAEDAVVEGARRAGVPLVDLRHLDLPEGSFADTHHLNGTGAAAASRALGRHLGDLGPHECGSAPPGP
jgi:hypothetical protein